MSIDSKNNQPVLLLFGPTAVGKTDLILDVFSGIGEVISADSMQVYRGMDIGTAKPGKEILDRVPHHLIDILDPDEQFDLGTFVRMADLLVDEIRARGKIPVISGGTAYYFKHYIYGLPSAPPSDPSVRTKLREEAEKIGPSAMYDRLKGIDPLSAERISEKDTYRILRALEVHRITGRPLSSFSVPRRIREGLDIRLIGLYRDRDDLHRRIGRRVDHMFEQGLVEEVKRLMARGYGAGDPGMRAIGYREFFTMREAGCFPLKTVEDMIKRDSRQYAKRQMTFFKSLPGIQWIRAADELPTVKLRDFFLQ